MVEVTFGVEVASSHRGRVDIGKKHQRKWPEIFLRDGYPQVRVNETQKSRRVQSHVHSRPAEWHVVFQSHMDFHRRLIHFPVFKQVFEFEHVTSVSKPCRLEHCLHGFDETVKNVSSWDWQRVRLVIHHFDLISAHPEADLKSDLGVVQVEIGRDRGKHSYLVDSREVGNLVPFQTLPMERHRISCPVHYPPFPTSVVRCERIQSMCELCFFLFIIKDVVNRSTKVSSEENLRCERVHHAGVFG